MASPQVGQGLDLGEDSLARGRCRGSKGADRGVTGCGWDRGFKRVTTGRMSKESHVHAHCTELQCLHKAKAKHTSVGADMSTKPRTNKCAPNAS